MIPPRYSEVGRGDVCLDKIASPWEGESSRLWSLWDVLRFYAYRFVRALSTLEYIATLEHIDFSLPENKPARLYLNRAATSLFKMLIEMDLNLSSASAADIELHIKNMDKVDDLFRQYVRELKDRLEIELKTRFFLVIMPGGREKYYNSSESIFGKDVANKFPELVEDISEAGNCFALDRYTACVFHLMRVMEKSVQKFAAKVDILPSDTYDEKWQTILNTIRGKINSLYPKHSDPTRIKYESIVAHLETIKIAWRNPTMHPKITYTEEEAKALLDAVRIFIKDLVKVL